MSARPPAPANPYAWAQAGFWIAFFGFAVMGMVLVPPFAHPAFPYPLFVGGVIYLLGAWTVFWIERPYRNRIWMGRLRWVRIACAVVTMVWVLQFIQRA